MPKRIKYFNPYPSAKKDYESSESRKADKAFYSTKEWRDSRAIHLSDNPICVDCLAAGRVNARQLEVHHTIDRKARPDLALEPTNYQTLCKSCHAKRK